MKLFKITTLALLLGTATIAVAQTRGESFADQFKQMQSLQAAGTYTFKPTPALGSRPIDPVTKQSFGENFAAMQAVASNSDQWTPNGEAAPTYASTAADPIARAPFSDTFAQMQAASSNSDAWKLAPAEGAPAYATAGTTTVAREATTPAFAQRIARAFRLPASSSAY